MRGKKGRIGLIMGIAAVIAAVAGGIIFYVMLSANQKVLLGKGFANMAEEMKAYRISVSDDIDFKALAEAGKSRPVHTKVDVSITNPDPSGSLGNVSLKLDSVTDVKNKLGKVDLRAGAYGVDMELGSIIADSSTLYAVSDLFFRGDVYSVGLENFGRDFNNSIWAKAADINMDENASFTLFPDGADADLSAFKDELDDIFKKNMSELASSAKYDKIMEKMEFDEAGGSASYGGVKVTVGKDAYNKAMENLKNDIFASRLYTKCVEQYEKIGSDNLSDKLSWYKGELDNTIELLTMIKAKGDIALNFYMDKKGRIRSIVSSKDIPVSMFDTQINAVSVNIDFTGEERRLDVIEGEMVYYAKTGGEVFKIGAFGVSRSACVTGESYDEDLTLRLGSRMSPEYAKVSYVNSWAYADKSYDMTVSASYEDSAVRLSARGGYEGIQKGKGFTLRVDSAVLNADDEDVLIASGKIATETLESSGIEVPQGATDALKMSEMDVMAAAMKAAGALEKFKNFQ